MSENIKTRHIEDAARAGTSETLAQLLDQAPELTPEELGFALFLAAHAESTACVELLIPRADTRWRLRGDRFFRDFSYMMGATALMAAADMMAPDCVRLLLPVSDAKAADDGGWTALLRACNDGTPAGFECAKLLLPFSDPTARSAASFDPMMAAALSGGVELTRLLLPLSDPKTKSDDGKTALLYALENGNWDCAELLFPVSDVADVSPGDESALSLAGCGERFAFALEIAGRLSPEALKEQALAAFQSAAVNVSGLNNSHILSFFARMADPIRVRAACPDIFESEAGHGYYANADSVALFLDPRAQRKVARHQHFSQANFPRLFAALENSDLREQVKLGHTTVRKSSKIPPADYYSEKPHSKRLANLRVKVRL